MRVKKGQHLSPNTEFKKGQHASPRTEFKKGHRLPSNILRKRIEAIRKAGKEGRLSRIPWTTGKRGIHLSPRTEFKKGHPVFPKTEKTRFKKGNTPWNRGKKGCWSEEALKKILRSGMIKPNKTEVRLLSILQTISPKWRYVGDGSLIIDGKCPDFWDGDGRLVELWGDYWHKDDDPQERIDFFKKHGYNCFVVWQHELSDEETLIKKLVVN